MSKRNKNNVNGILLLDKPDGMTSNSALHIAKRIFNAKKAGHTGSLDPIATGLLPICFGEATKLSGFLLEASKHYQTRIKLGITTNTGDLEGEIVHQRPVKFTRRQLDTVIDDFRGEFDQVPPMFSAIKQNGQPLYKLARKGIEVERKPRRVNVYSLEVTQVDDQFIDLDILCSSGFYVRSLAYDIGEQLGCGAHVVALRRLAVGHLNIENATTLEDLENQQDNNGRLNCLIPSDRGLPHLPEVNLSVDAAFYLCRGQAVNATGLPHSGWVRLYSEGAGFLGLGTVLDDGRVAPKRLFNI